MLNITYKHLQDPVKLGPFSFVQWTQLAICGLLAYGVSKLLPLPAEWSLSFGITICGTPAAAAMVAMQADFDVLAFTLAVARWYRKRGRYLPGADPNSQRPGYRLTVAHEDVTDHARVTVDPLRAHALWDARRGLVIAALDGGRLAQRDDRPDVAVSHVVHGGQVIALVHRARGGRRTRARGRHRPAAARESTRYRGRCERSTRAAVRCSVQTARSSL